MSGVKKNIFNGAFLLLVLLITLYSVFHGENLSELLIYLKQGDLRYWLLGAVFVVGFIESESVIIYYMMKVLGENVKLTHCFLYSFVGFFFSLITPSATGGQPAQLYFMKKDKLSLPTSTMVLLIVTITYKLVLVVLGLVVMILRPEPVWRLLKPIYGWCYLGIFLNVVCVFGMLILVFHPTLASNIVLFCLRLFDRIFKKDMEKKYGGRLERAMEKYRYAAEFFYKNIKVIVHIINGLPGEDYNMMMETAKAVANMGVDGIKIHLLHVIKDTPMEKMLQKGMLTLMSQEEYINLVCDQLEILPETMIVHRLTGDGKRDELVGPLWSLKKWEVLNAIDDELKRRNSYQGIKYNK